jgi:hypothetical protein
MIKHRYNLLSKLKFKQKKSCESIFAVSQKYLSSRVNSRWFTYNFRSFIDFKALFNGIFLIILTVSS